MLILGVSGSLRRGSHNTALLHAAARVLPAGVALARFDALADIPPFDEDHECEPAPAAVRRLREASMPHPREHSPPQRPLEPEDAVVLAEQMAMFATASRLRILYALLGGERSVEGLAEAAGLPANTVSQQLRMLRSTRLVRVRREGRRAIYALHDPHVADLLTAVRHHAEHAAHGWAEGVPSAAREELTR